MLIDLVEIAKRIFRSDSWEYVFGGKGQDKDGDYFSGKKKTGVRPQHTTRH